MERKSAEAQGPVRLSLGGGKRVVNSLTGDQHGLEVSVEAAGGKDVVVDVAEAHTVCQLPRCPSPLVVADKGCPDRVGQGQAL